MILRVRRKGEPPRDIDLGPHTGTVERLPIQAMRRPLDEAIVYAADHARQIRLIR